MEKLSANLNNIYPISLIILKCSVSSALNCPEINTNSYNITKIQYIQQTHRETCCGHLIIEGEEGVKFLNCDTDPLCERKAEEKGEIVRNLGLFLESGKGSKRPTPDNNPCRLW